jgi:hypothetical protein
MIRKIISGGQTGADQGGLAAAKILKLETGGWLPKGCRTEAGPRRDFLELYGMREHADWRYPPRTWKNVNEARGTLIFGDSASPGCKLTVRYCRLEMRSFWIVPWRSGFPLPDETARSNFCLWAHNNRVEVLNVAGNREEKQPGIFDACRDFLIVALDKGLWK